MTVMEFKQEAVVPVPALMDIILLHVDPHRSKRITDKIDQGDLSEKPGWVRMSIHPTMTNEELYLITKALREIVENIDKWQKDYTYDIYKNEYLSHFCRWKRERKSKKLV